MKTTLAEIRRHAPCYQGWHKLLNFLGKSKVDSEQLSLLTVLESNGISDAVWCLRAVDGCDDQKRMFAVWCARQVVPLIKSSKANLMVEFMEQANGKPLSMALVEKPVTIEESRLGYIACEVLELTWMAMTQQDTLGSLLWRIFVRTDDLLARSNREFKPATKLRRLIKTC